MNTMMTASPPARSPGRETAEAHIARYIAESQPIEHLVAEDYLTDTDGRLVARQMREPQLRQALAFSVCHAVRPDVDDFYQEDGEEDAVWRQRGARTIRDHCNVCPVRAACAELALREDDIVGIRGGLLPQELRRLQTEDTTWVGARAEDERAAEEQRDRIRAAAEVLRLAGQYIGGSVPADKRRKNRRKTNEARRRRDELLAAHRRTAGWTDVA